MYKYNWSSTHYYPLLNKLIINISYKQHLLTAVYSLKFSSDIYRFSVAKDLITIFQPSDMALR